MELGIYTFADVSLDPQSGKPLDVHRRINDLMEEIRLADQAGLDIFAVGEHHRPDYSVSSPATILAAAAMVTKNIRLSSGVTVLSSDDPVRVFQSFATVDHLSGGRAEIMAGRGSFIESFPLFGYDLKDYDTLFSEKLELLLKINEQEHVSWKGRHRAPLTGQGVYPRPYQPALPVWIAAGGTPESLVRAARLGLPVNLAIIGGNPAQFLPLINLYRETAAQHGHADSARVGIGAQGYIAARSSQADTEFFPHYAEMMGRIGRERGWPPTGRAQYEAMKSPSGALLAGDPQEVIDKILHIHHIFRNDRLILQMDVGAVPHDQLMRSIELFGDTVAPAVRKALGQ